MLLRYPGGSLDLAQARIMGILNLTPDSFSDGGRYNDRAKALDRARRMIDEGAQILDVGAESTRPGAQLISAEEEMDRLLPVVEALATTADCVISVDTMKPEVMRAVIAAGAHMINDVNGLTAAGAIEAVRDTGAAACVMHMQGLPATMQAAPHYDAVVDEVLHYLRARRQACLDAGIPEDRLLFDPGFGFGKRLDDNLALLAELERFVDAGLPMLIGVSRKSMFGELLGLEVQQRLVPSVTAAVIAVTRGACVVRVHDVAETAQALRVVRAAATRTRTI